MNTTRAKLEKELGVQQEARLQALQQEMEKDAAHREQAAVASAVRKIVAHLTGVDPSDT